MMEAPAPTPQPRVLGRGSMFRFFRSLASSTGSRRSPRQPPVQDQGAGTLMLGCQGGRGRQPGPTATLPSTLSVARPQGFTHLPGHNPLGLAMEDMRAQTPDPKEVLRVAAQAVEAVLALPTGSQGTLDNLSKEGQEKQRPAGEAPGDMVAPDRSCLAWALELEPEYLQGAWGPAEDCTGEEEKDHLLDDDPGLASSKAGLTPWNRLLCLYKQLQRSATVKEALLREEEKMEDENSSLQLCVPRIVTLQSPLRKAFRLTDTVGFGESELKKLVAGQQESCLWKLGSREHLEHQELLSWPGSTLEEGVVKGQHLLPEETDHMGN